MMNEVQCTNETKENLFSARVEGTHAQLLQHLSGRHQEVERRRTQMQRFQDRHSRRRHRQVIHNIVVNILLLLKLSKANLYKVEIRSMIFLKGSQEFLRG